MKEKITKLIITYTITTTVSTNMYILHEGRKGTSKALVCDLEVWRGIDGARPGGVQLRIGQWERAVTTSWTASIQQRQNVRAAADVTEVALNTAAQLHATVASSADEDDLMTSAATDVDRLHVAVLVHCQRRACNVPQHFQ